MADIIIETERLILRTQADSDYAVWLAHMNTENVRRYLGGLEEPHNIEAAFARVDASQAKEGFGFWFVALKESGKLIGSCGLKRVDAGPAPEHMKGDMEIGWIIREDEWGKGYATEAALASLDYAFTRTDAPHVVALTSESNVPSWRMMEKLGMERRPELEFVDPDFPPEDNPTIVYSITIAQWEAQQESK